jgi:hypothetical protein
MWVRGGRTCLLVWVSRIRVSLRVRVGMKNLGGEEAHPLIVETTVHAIALRQSQGKVSAPPSSYILGNSDPSHQRHHHSRRLQYSLLHCIPFADSQRPQEARSSCLDRAGRPNPSEPRPSVPGTHTQPLTPLEQRPLPTPNVASRTRGPGTGSGREDSKVSHPNVRPYAWIELTSISGAYV